jgi:site-specific DNA-methyltransferase (adenine-specific)
MLGDSRFLPLKSESVDCVITSPPYWSLRKYDIPDLIWDGEEECRHEWGNKLKITGRHHKGETNPGKEAWYKERGQIEQTGGNFCLKCSAWRGQLGLEPTIELYLKHLLECFDEVWRVLKKEGTLWVNLGDSYWSAKGSCFNPGGGNKSWKSWNEAKFKHPVSRGNKSDMPGLPPKSLCLIPERFAIAMVDRGWILRNKIVWHKPNCMPASVKDRFTVDFEPVFFFTKSRRYWFEQLYETYDRPLNRWGGDSLKKECEKTSKYLKTQNIGSSSCLRAGRQMRPNESGRNRRCVWTIPTAPYKESHFAVFSEALVEPMIRAGCPKGGIVLDPFCGSGTMMRVAEKLSRVGIGFDLGYQDLQKKRIKNIQKELL